MTNGNSHDRANSTTVTVAPERLNGSQGTPSRSIAQPPATETKATEVVAAALLDAG